MGSFGNNMWFKKLFSLLKKRESLKEKPPLSVVFSRFREIMDSNTSALEIMADMGDKLSGDYIFDIAYIRQVTKKLSEYVFKSIHSLNLLSQNKYELLYQIHSKISSKVEALIEGKDENAPLILFLEEIGPEDLDLVGGKMAHLAEIKKHLNLKIPNGFVITTSAFKKFIKYNNLDSEVEKLTKIAGSKDFEEKRKFLKDSILQSNLPPILEKEIKKALIRYNEVCNNRPLVVRSSAQEEDQALSFAGQFETIVNVEPELEALCLAYKKVVASLFGKRAVSYVFQFDTDLLKMSMAVGCMELINARTSGVMFTVNPQDPKLESILITSNWGLGISVVEGKFPTDKFLVLRGDPNKILTEEVLLKEKAIFPKENKIVEEDLKNSKKKEPSLSPEEITKLAKIGLSLERYFKKPQDIEWAIDKEGNIYILQSRPITQISKSVRIDPIPEIKRKYKIISENKGRVAQGGISTGQVFILKNIEDLENFPEGAILVAHRDSSQFVRVMPKASAILTNVGSPTSHMATLCREFRVPAIVGIGNITELVSQGETITVDADDNCIYKGEVEELLKFQAASQLDLAETREFKLLRKILHIVSPLNLVDPIMKEFKPENCKTFHDILRFCHEKAVQELINIGKEGTNLLDKKITKKLDLPIPTGILVIDLGGGLKEKAKTKSKVNLEDIECLPFKAVILGMLEPGVWQTQAIQMKFKDLMSSILRTPDITPKYIGENIAVISTYYLNLSLRFGYHFNIIDIYSSPNVRENHIYFRFIGGAADLAKRTRRIRLIEKILTYYDFNVVTKGDLLVARLANIPIEEIQELLQMIGRLIAFTRQLDVIMDNDNIVEETFKKFISKNFNLQ